LPALASSIWSHLLEETTQIIWCIGEICYNHAVGITLPINTYLVVALFDDALDFVIVHSALK
jgi:hypothetical protein